MCTKKIKNIQLEVCELKYVQQRIRRQLNFTEKNSKYIRPGLFIDGKIIMREELFHVNEFFSKKNEVKQKTVFLFSFPQQQ